MLLMTFSEVSIALSEHDNLRDRRGWAGAFAEGPGQ